MTRMTQTAGQELYTPHERAWPRWLFAGSLGLYGGALGAAVIVTNIVGQTSKFAVDADRLPPSDILYFGGLGALTGFMIAGLAGYLVNRSPRAFTWSKSKHGMGPLAWAAFGVVFWLSYSLLIGGFALPQANVTLAYIDGAIPLSHAFGFTLDNVFGFPLRMVSEGGQFMYTSAPTAIAFAVGGWAIDFASTSGREASRRFAPLLAAAALAAVVIASVLALPATTLWHIGNLTTETQAPR